MFAFKNLSDPTAIHNGHLEVHYNQIAMDIARQCYTRRPRRGGNHFIAFHLKQQLSNGQARGVVINAEHNRCADVSMLCGPHNSHFYSVPAALSVNFRTAT